jgi:hypothetical protein
MNPTETKKKILFSLTKQRKDESKQNKDVYTNVEATTCIFSQSCWAKNKN